ncbi:MAG: fatty acid desaturase [Cyanobacteriota bacterium]|nr:fatty acid desaturase [Cyanobacteriota bacterium]
MDRPRLPQIPQSQDQLKGLDGLLVRAVADLHGPPSRQERWFATGRLLALGLVLVGGSIIYWALPARGWGLAVLPVAGVAYALLLIATHEMVHGTFWGWRSLEFGLGCLLSWPMAWPFATYSRLHLLHHRWNGRDPRDPERTQRLPEESRVAPPWRRWLHLHPFASRCLALGGVGLILDTAHKGWRLRAVDPRLPKAQWCDGIGVVLVHGTLLLLAIWQGEVVRYLLFWFVLERVIGAIVQYRGLVEHHGLWGGAESLAAGAVLPQRLRQLATCRDVVSGPWRNALMGGLPHHSAHHAFPALPSARLPLASQRLNTVLLAQHWPLPSQLGRYADALQIVRRPFSDGSAEPSSAGSSSTSVRMLP